MGHPIRLRRRVALTIATATLGTPSFLVATTPSDAASRVSGCHPKRQQVVARKGGAVVFRRVTGPEGEYGAPSMLLACLNPRQRPVRIAEFSEGEAPFFERLLGPNPVFAGHYVAFALDDTDIVCSKYEPSSPQCETHEVASYDLKTGHARARAAGTPAALVITERGWIAWVEGSAHSLLAFDSHGLHTLDAGPVDPRSLAARGQSVGWTSGGVAHTTELS
jgi:hypothetical protein